MKNIPYFLPVVYMYIDIDIGLPKSDEWQITTYMWYILVRLHCEIWYESLHSALFGSEKVKLLKCLSFDPSEYVGIMIWS